MLESPGGHKVTAFDKDTLLRLNSPQDSAAQCLEAALASAPRMLGSKLHRLSDEENAEHVRRVFSRQPDAHSRLGHSRFAVEWLPSG